MTILDLEQKIMRCWGILDMLEDTEHGNALKVIYDKEFEKLFTTFEKLCEEHHALRRDRI
jgi:uncharacterized protein (DUF2249 family)